ncbi:hypothetical protein [Sulfitobacter sp. R18_1]|uniref:hypothetical protein n=1 Tax=Sulfitobacter sp. R18_1 TaxID=2821104 RepID=UPI001ADB9E5F|nr:hypothetical protein [Sulfitobacter sp. R18_1]MBO9428394.1 hypothetical protein [Sulfitobacter sp. R18_1]
MYFFKLTISRGERQLGELMRDAGNILSKLQEVERTVYAILKSEASKENYALKKMYSDYERKKEQYKESLAEAKILKEAKPSLAVRYLPIAGRMASQSLQDRADSATRVAKKLKASMNKISDGAADRRGRIRTYKDYAVWFREFSVFVRHHSSWFDGSFEMLVARLEQGTRSIKASKGYTKGADLISFLSRHKFEMESWVDNVRVQIMELAERPSPVHRDPEKIRSEITSTGSTRIYLPAPLSVQARLKKMGARVDDDVAGKKFGISSLYLDYSKDLKLIKTRFERQLPLIFRTKKKPFSFEEMPKNAGGQNLRKVFEKESWSFIRDTMLGTTGKRCSVCGGQGGKMLDSFYTQAGDQTRRDTVDCHEVWEFEVLDAQEGIGVQRLKKLMMVCVDCHMMFHEEFAISKGYREGADADGIREFLRERMAALNGVERADIDIQRNREMEVTRSNEGVDTWLMDLSYLQENENMMHQEPVFREENEAGVNPSMIAGLDFVTQDGQNYEAREVSELYEELLREMEQTVGQGFR